MAVYVIVKSVPVIDSGRGQRQKVWPAQTSLVVIIPAGAGVRQLVALFIVFKGESSSGGPEVCSPENF